VTQPHNPEDEVIWKLMHLGDPGDPLSEPLERKVGDILSHLIPKVHRHEHVRILKFYPPNHPDKEPGRIKLMSETSKWRGTVDADDVNCTFVPVTIDELHAEVDQQRRGWDEDADALARRCFAKMRGISEAERSRNVETLSRNLSMTIGIHIQHLLEYIEARETGQWKGLN
jgi:hypothetical protein